MRPALCCTGLLAGSIGGILLERKSPSSCWEMLTLDCQGFESVVIMLPARKPYPSLTDLETWRNNCAVISWEWRNTQSQSLASFIGLIVDLKMQLTLSVLMRPGRHNNYSHSMMYNRYESYTSVQWTHVRCYSCSTLQNHISHLRVLQCANAGIFEKKWPLLLETCCVISSKKLRHPVLPTLFSRK